MNPRYHLPILILLGAFLFLTNLGGYDLWPPDEPRFAQVAREMLHSGDYLVPRVNGQPYTEKPPMLFWTTALLSAPVGDVTEFTARLPLAIGGLVTIVLTYLLAQSLYGTSVAFWAALILMTTHRFWWQARFGQIDMLMTMFLTASLLCFWHWHKNRQSFALVGFYLAIAAAVLTKGPPGLVFPFFMILVFYWGKKQDRKDLHWVVGTVVVLIIVAAWLIPARMAVSVESGMETGDGIAANLFRQTIGRFFLGISHAKWPGFYATHMPVDLLPWGLFLPWTLYWGWKRRKDGEEMRLLLAWTIPAFLFFSACIGKRSIYLLPLYPVLAIFLSRSILELVESDRRIWRRNTGLLWAAALTMLAFAPLVFVMGPYKEYGHPSILAVSILALACGMQGFYAALRTDSRQLLRDMTTHSAILVLLCALVIFPAINPYKSARAFCAPLRACSQQNRAYDLYSVGFSREEYIYYAEHFHEPVLCELLPISEMNDLPTYEQARLQSKMQRDIQKAVRPVPIATMAVINDQELERLQQAVFAYQGPDGDNVAKTQAYEEAVSKRIRQLFAGMNIASPAFMMVLEEDWRWVVALCPEGRSYGVLSDTNVGSRRVLLLANDAALEAVEAGEAHRIAALK